MKHESYLHEAPATYDAYKKHEGTYTIMIPYGIECQDNIVKVVVRIVSNGAVSLSI